MEQIRAFLIEQNYSQLRCACRSKAFWTIAAMKSLLLLKQIVGLQQDWIWTDKRFEMTASGIKPVSESGGSYQRLITIPGI